MQIRPMTAPKILVDGLIFPECPRWHDGKLWVSDMFGYRVVRVDLKGNLETVAEFHDVPSGLGFLPDGTPIVIQRFTRQILRLVNGKTAVHADLNVKPSHSLNDRVVDDNGRAYVGYYTIG